MRDGNLVYHRAAPRGKSYVRAHRAQGETDRSTGKCRIAYEGRTITAEDGANLDLSTTDGKFVDAILIRMCGHWGHETGGSGLFTVEQGDPALDRGDPVSYPKETAFDSHYHDCNEYWIVFCGQGVTVSEGKSYEVGPGDCIATGAGHPHDFPRTFEPVKAVYFETTHGPAQPVHVQELLARAQESLAVQTRDVVCGLIDVEQR